MALNKICELGMFAQKPIYYEMILHQNLQTQMCMPKEWDHCL
jgi:hypothetical protein